MTGPGENSDPSLCLIPRLLYGLLILSHRSYLPLQDASSSDSPTLQLLLSSVWHPMVPIEPMVPSVCPLLTPWKRTSPLLLYHTILPTSMALFRSVSPALLARSPFFLSRDRCKACLFLDTFLMTATLSPHSVTIITFGWFFTVESHRTLLQSYSLVLEGRVMVMLAEER